MLSLVSSLEDRLERLEWNFVQQQTRLEKIEKLLNKYKKKKSSI